MSMAVSGVHSAVGEFQRPYIYKCFIETIPSAVSTAFSNASSFQSNVDFYNDKAVFPDRKTDPIKVQWGGEFFEVPGVDNSTREADFVFYMDEPMWAYDFFRACKDLTGNETNHAGVYGVEGKFDMGVALVSVTKDTIKAYRRLKGCRVYGVTYDNVEKGGSEIGKLTVNIHWDRNVEDTSKRGNAV